MSLDILQRATKVYSSVGKPTAMLQGLDAADLEEFASLCGEDGVLVDGFKKKHDAMHLAYCEKNKAVVADEPIPEEAGEEATPETTSLFNDGGDLE